MISNPKYGWCKFQIDEFVGSPSYLTMVPIDLLEGFIKHLKTNETVDIHFDEEGTDFTLFLDSSDLRIEKEDWDIDTDEERLICVTIHRNIQDLAEELISDIKSDINGWANFHYDEKTTEINKNRIQELIQELKGLIK